MHQLNAVNSREIRRFVAERTGEFHCRYKLDSSGIFWFVAEKRDKNGQVLDQSNRFPIVIKENNRELTAISDKSRFLQQLADVTGGQVFSLVDTGKLLNILKKPQSILKIRKSHNHNYIFEALMILLAVFLMAVEWLLRKIEQSWRN